MPARIFLLHYYFVVFPFNFLTSFNLILYNLSILYIIRCIACLENWCILGWVITISGVLLTGLTCDTLKFKYHLPIHWGNSDSFFGQVAHPARAESEHLWRAAWWSRARRACCSSGPGAQWRGGTRPRLMRCWRASRSICGRSRCPAVGFGTVAAVEASLELK